MNETVLFCAYKSVLCEGMTLETQYLGSRPTRACELKLFAVMIYLDEFSSRPTRACELKYHSEQDRFRDSRVTPYTGV